MWKRRAAKLMKRYKLTELQATAILDMQLRRLAALERKKIETEYKEISALIKDLEGLLKSPRRCARMVAEELLQVKAHYARPPPHADREPEGGPGQRPC